MFTTVYDQDSFEAVARVVQSRNKDCDDLKIYHYHNNHLGTPQELTDDDGNVVWCNYEYAWGGNYKDYYKEQSLNGIAIQDYELQPLKFQGQSLDIETGLHYNRFRYYDSDVGMFIQRDPIGLLGGVNVFAYAPNPIHWVDVLGLNRFTKTNWKSTAEGGTGYQYKVYQQPIDWDLEVNTRDGVKTNLELAETGRTPFVVKDGKYSPINLHHSKQNAKGSLFELSSATHKKYHGSNALHPYLPKPHPINPVPDVRENFKIDREEYWMDRARAERIKRNNMNSSKC